MSASPEFKTEGTEPASAPAREFRIIQPNQTPAGALMWRNSTEKGRARWLWRIGFKAMYGANPRHLLLGWCLEALSGRDGFSTASDSYLAKETGLPLKSVQAGLTAMDRSDAIIRVHVAENGTFKRRIFLAEAMAERGRDTPCGRGYGAPSPIGGADTPCHRGREKRKGQTAEWKRRLTPKDQARLDADRRAARARGEISPHWLADDVPEAGE
jgi:hypothetical protein